jgi:hypothetical protein
MMPCHHVGGMQQPLASGILAGMLLDEEADIW